MKYFIIFKFLQAPKMQNIRLLTFFLFLTIAAPVAAQEVFIIENDTLELKREVKGPLSLYWTREGLDYRYFVQKKDRMLELKNTRIDGSSQEEYKEQLKELTADAKIRTNDVKFVLYSLRYFVNRYNQLVQEDYEFNESTSDIKQRIGLFVGLSNNIYTENSENVLSPIIGLEYEFFDPNLAPRHSAFIQFRQNFKQDEYRYSASQLSINYRFKAFYFTGFDLHVDVELATFLYSQDQILIRNDAGEVTAVKDESGFTFTAPFSFGVGTDIKVTPNSFVSVSYNDFFSIILDGNQHFPLDFTVGYKYNLN